MLFALCQMNILWEDKSANIDKVLHFVQKAKKANADIIIFPEMSLTGFSMNISNTKENGESVDIIRGIARDNNIAIGLGWVKDCGEKGENRYTFVDNKGKILSEYTKLHPFSFSGEDKYFISGDKLAKFSYKERNIGSLICYDLRFPEIFQALSDNCDIIVVSACWPNKRSEHWKILLKARAIENQCYIVGVNCVGNVGGIYYSGDSMVVNPDGVVLDCISDREGLLLVNIDDDVDVFRSNFNTKNDRKTTLYKQLM